MFKRSGVTMKPGNCSGGTRCRRYLQTCQGKNFLYVRFWLADGPTYAAPISSRLLRTACPVKSVELGLLSSQLNWVCCPSSSAKECFYLWAKPLWNQPKIAFGGTELTRSQVSREGRQHSPKVL